MAPVFPAFAPFPEAPWRDHIVPVEWEACLSLWVSLTEAHLSLGRDDFQSISAKDESLNRFVVDFMREVAASGITILGLSVPATSLFRHVYILATRLLKSTTPPTALLQWEFLSDLSRVYGKKRTIMVLTDVFKSHPLTVETSLHGAKKSLILALDSGIKGDLRIPEARLKHLNHLFHASPDAAALFMAGSDFLDGLISCYKIMNPPLRKTIVATAYLCLVGLTEGEAPKFSILIDQLYSLKVAADAHKDGPTSGNDSMVAELVTVSPLLKQVQHRLEQSGSTTTRMKSVISGLEAYRKPGSNMRPKRLVKRKIDKGKAVAEVDEEEEVISELRVHKMSQISQIQDLFPELGTGFVSQLLDEYQNDTEQVVAHLLEDDLPPYLASVDRARALLVMFAIFYRPAINTIPDHPKGLEGGEAAWRQDPPHRRCLFVTMSSMMMSSTLVLGFLTCTLASETLGRRQTIFSRTDQRRLTRQPSCLRSLRSMQTMMSGMTLTMLPMLA